MDMTAAAYDAEALTARIKALSLISGSGITVTMDARISAYEEGKPFTIIPSVQGNNVDEAKTISVIEAAGKGGTGIRGRGPGRMLLPGQCAGKTAGS